MNLSFLKKIGNVRSGVKSVRALRFHFGNPRVDWMLSLCIAGLFVAGGLYITSYVENLIGSNKTIEELQRAAYEKQVLIDEKMLSELLSYYVGLENELARLKISPPRLVDPSL